MRLHHLSMAAFGPFARVEEVDFDALCGAGLFLLTGPTGAGKTTILDAVCFALYGSVPGVRGVKALKSQHAPDDARPEVVLDFSVRGRRFVVRRSPEWRRPKRRGDGFTSENARATLVETTNGGHHLLSSRAQEVGHLVSELVGMQSTQFVQVAMLPQGDFQKFLRASSQDRHEVLQHLFRTDRYARIEDWVHEHSRGLRERSTDLQQAVVRALDTVADRAAVEVPEAMSGEALGTGEAADGVLPWVDDLLDAAGAAHGVELDRHATAVVAWAEARSRQEEGSRRHALHERRDRARAELEGLEHEAAVDRDARAALDADQRASRCVPLLRMLDDAAREHAEAEAAWGDTARSIGSLDAGDLSLAGPVSVAALADAEQRARAAAARLEALLPREQELQETRERLSDAESEAATVATEHALARERAVTLPARLAEARTRSGGLSAAAARADALALELDAARLQFAAACHAAAGEAELPRLRDAEREARDRAADARDRVQDLTARRLEGIAAELAGGLVDGQACQVCGSSEHPAPASAGGPQVTDAEQAEAAAALDVASAVHARASGRVLQAEERLAGRREAAAHQDVPTARARVESLTEQLAAAEHARSELGHAVQSAERLEAEQGELTAATHELALRLATLHQTVETHRRTIGLLTTELAAEIDVAVPLAEQRSRLVALGDALARARESLVAEVAADTKVAELEARATESAGEHGFDGVASLRRAVLPPEERHRLEELVETRARAAARARAVLDDESVLALPDGPPPPVAALAEASAAAEEQQAEAAKSLHLTETLLDGLRRQRTRLEAALAAWAPVREEYLRAESMAKLVRGMGADNQLQMRLSAYVLATRLDQVVAAANERLGHMRDQRYLLQRTGRAARKGAQAGLGLEVVDQWTGDVRDPATLSGGETFVVSLSLALGLADVVTQEAGGTEIETLFVDEGFGTLDAETLDDVMDRLDELRAGGRAVGVVSHVSELRNRIPTQLHVEKSRSGSMVAVRTMVG